MNTAESMKAQSASLKFAAAIVSPEGKILVVSSAYRDAAASSKTLRSIGETWVAPHDGEASVQEVPIEVNGGCAKLVILTRKSPE